MKTYRTEKSRELFEKAKHSLVGGVASSIHKGAWQEYPLYIERGKGSKIYDVDGNEYIDYMMAFGPMILGYSPETVNAAVRAQLDLGTQLAAPTEQLIELSDELIEIIPCAEKVSTYLCSGTEANAHAIRLARAYTGKTKLIKFEGHYHGWLDEEKVSCEALAPSELGPRNKPWKLKHFAGQSDPDNVIILPYNDLELFERTLDRWGNEIACVILETVMMNAEPVPPKKGFLEGLRELTKKHNVVLIFDEVITGFRMALGGAQEYFGVTPDLATFAKAIAGGYPISAVVGKEEVVAAGTATAGTFNGNPLVVAAALATIKELRREGCYQRMGKLSGQIVEGIRGLGTKYGIKVHAEAWNSIWTMQFGIDQPLTDYRDHFDKVDKTLYQKVCKFGLERGIRFNPWRGRSYLSTAHTEEDVKKTLEVIDLALADALSQEK